MARGKQSSGNPSARELAAFMHEIADLADAAVLPYFRRRLDVSNKDSGGGFDPVTAADRKAEAVLRSAIRARYPDHAIEGEELGRLDGDAQVKWVIDPIDGTRAFIIGAPLWGTLIGVEVGGRPTLGLMSQPFTRERFWSDGRQARWRGLDGPAKKLRTRGCGRLEDAILTSTHPDLFAVGHEQAAFEALRRRVRMTRFGGDCYNYCLLAAGHIDLVVEAGLKPYDIVALVPIIEAAGGVVTTWDGKPATAGGRILAAGDPAVHRQALRLLGER